MEPISIVIPAYNEEAAIGPVLDALQSQLSSWPVELIVVDDGSTDATGAVATDHGAHVVRHALNAGYGRSVKTGVQHAVHDLIVVTDADGTYPIDHISLLLAAMERGCDMAVGARQGKIYRGSLFKWMGRGFLKMIVEFATGRAIPDVNSGLRVFRKHTAQPYFPDICDGFSFTTTITLVYLLTHKMVAFLPVPYEKRIGESKVRILKDSLRTLQYITECIIRYNPLKLYLVLCLMLLALGCVFIFWLGLLSFFLGIMTVGIVAAIGFLAESMRRPRV